jgi:hypothetical protein
VTLPAMQAILRLCHRRTRLVIHPPQG